MTSSQAAADLQRAVELYTGDLLHARQLILMEPLHEPAHRSYLRWLGRLKRYGEALFHS